MFRIEWKEGSLKQLSKLENFLAKRIIKKVEELKYNPFSKDVSKLRGREGFRIRIGSYRVIFDNDNKKKLIYILRIGHRKNIYD